MQVVEYKDAYHVIPTIPEAEALEMLLVQKDDPFAKTTQAVQARTLYDRMRGIFITCGFQHDRMVDAIHNVVNNISPTAILMDTQGDGKVEHITLNDYNHPDTSGFPSRDFCLELYTQDEPSDTAWEQLFGEDVLMAVEAFKKDYRESNRVFNLMTEEANGVKQLTFKEPRLPEMEIVPEILSLGDALKVVQAPTMEKMNPRSHIAVVDNGQEISTAKRMPTFAECVLRVLQNEGVKTVRQLCQQFAVSIPELQLAQEQVHFYTIGWSPTDLVSVTPIITPAPTVQEQQAEVVREKVKLAVSQSTPHVVAALKQQAQPIVPAFTEVEMQEEYLTLLRRNVDKWQNQMTPLEAMALINQQLSKERGKCRWKTRVTDRGNADIRVTMMLQVPEPGEFSQAHLETPEGHWETIAQAESLNQHYSRMLILRAMADATGTHLIWGDSDTSKMPRVPKPTVVKTRKHPIKSRFVAEPRNQIQPEYGEWSFQADIEQGLRGETEPRQVPPIKPMFAPMVPNAPIIQVTPPIPPNLYYQPAPMEGRAEYVDAVLPHLAQTQGHDPIAAYQAAQQLYENRYRSDLQFRHYEMKRRRGWRGTPESHNYPRRQTQV